MPPVLYCARTFPPLDPPFPSPPATQQHVEDLDDPNYSPASPLPDDPNNQEQYYYESETDSQCPEQPSSFNSEKYSYLWDECFQSHVLNVPEYANAALEHYNSQDKHEIKYQLIEAIVSCVIRYDGTYQHVNFTAKSTLENSKEFFFAELRRDLDIQAWVPVCIVALEENERVGGFSELLGDGGVDPWHCFGCGDIMKHPLDGSLYEAGHYLVENCFIDRYIEVLPAT